MAAGREQKGAKVQNPCDGRLFVLGHPVAHSKSPVMHNAAYRALGLDWTYGLKDCPTLEEAREFLEAQCWMALNITMPYKPLAFAVAAHRMEDAQVVQGANVLVNTKRGLVCDNTDGRGCIAYLQREGIDFAGARVAVCGTGPTSLALLHSAGRAGAQALWLLGRDDARARRVADDYRERLEGLDEAFGNGSVPEVTGGSYDRFGSAIAQADIILDATPLGMGPQDGAPFPLELLSAGQTVFDVVYGHGPTALLKAARAAGCRAFDGAGMLVAQAVLTVYDIVDLLQVPVDLRSADLFALMAQAADFRLSPASRS